MSRERNRNMVNETERGRDIGRERKREREREIGNRYFRGIIGHGHVLLLTHAWQMSEEGHGPT
jgi:hypothetical protein